MLACLVAALLFSATPAMAQSIPGAVPDYVSSDNVERVGSIRTVGDGVGATIIGNTMYVTSTVSLSIWDITNAESPQQIGVFAVDVEFENEEVPTNGKILGISGQIGCKDPTAINGPDFGSNATGCLTLYDVSNPAAPTVIKSVSGAGEHTNACVLDCTWFYGSGGAITDARDPANAKVVGDWVSSFPDGTFKSSCHHVREVQPGYILGSCQPVVLMSVLAKDGGSPEKPVIIAKGNNTDNRFIHSSRWPRKGRDVFMLGGGETNAQPQCDDTVGAFMVWDAKEVLAPVGFNLGSQFKMLSEIRPQNGNYADGWSPVNGLGCSVHWFEEHPTFRNGGLVALAEYENGTRLLQIQPNGKIVEQGFFLPIGGSASAPHWHPNGKVFYTIDYARGFDVVRYTGDTYQGPEDSASATPGATPAACASAAGFDTVAANPLRKGVRFSVATRQEKTFDVEIRQYSSGRKLVNGKVRAKFTGKKASFDWSGKDRSGKALTDGLFSVRFTMRLDGKVRDVRRLTLERKGGVFRPAPDAAQRTGCGPFESYGLSGPAFGGKGKKPLTISYKLAEDAKAVTLVARVGSKVVRTFKGGTAKGKVFRYRLPAGSVRRGSQVKIVATVEQGTPTELPPLTAKRL
jgi:hypothetical protein